MRVKLSYFSQNFENLQRFFTREPWPWLSWTWCPQGGFRGKLSFKKMSAGGCLCTLQENPHFWVPKIKVRPPDGIFFVFVIAKQDKWLSVKIFTEIMHKGLAQSWLLLLRMLSCHHSQSWCFHSLSSQVVWAAARESTNTSRQVFEQRKQQPRWVSSWHAGLNQPRLTQKFHEPL